MVVSSYTSNLFPPFMKKIIISLLILVGVVLPFVALAAEIRTGENVNITSKDTIQDDLYSAGSSVVISGTIGGDFISAGGNISVSGNIKDDLIAAGGTINISGDVGGDVRVAGGNVTIDSAVAEDLMVTGGQVTLTERAVIGGSLYIVGGSVVVNGKVVGETSIQGGSVTLDGTFVKDVKVKAGEKITIGSHSVFDSKVEAVSPNDVEIKEGSVFASPIEFTQKNPMNHRAAPLFAIFGTLLLFKFVTMATAAILLVLLLPRVTSSVVRQTMSGFWKNVLMGFVTFFVSPIAIVLLLVSVVGVGVGVMAIMFYILLIIVTAILSGLYTGVWADSLRQKTKDISISWIHALIGTIILSIVAIIPFVGWICVLLIFLGTLGGVVKTAYKGLKG